MDHLPVYSKLSELPGGASFAALAAHDRFDEVASGLVAQIAELAERKGQRLVTAESCTGGWIAQQLSARPGSSAWFDSALVTYSNAAKTSLLTVEDELLASSGPGAVSEQTVLAMTAGALASAGGRARVAVAVSGVAGPDGGSAEKPVGTVWIAWQAPECHQARRFLFPGDRQRVRQATVLAALAGLVTVLQPEG